MQTSTIDNILTDIQAINTLISTLSRNTLAHQVPFIKLTDDPHSVEWFFCSDYGTDVFYPQCQ